MYNLSDIAGLNLNFSNSGLAAGTTKGTVKHGALNFAINSLAYTRAATDNIAPTFVEGKLKTVPANSTCSFSVWVDGQGNYSFNQGAIVGGNGKAPSPDDTGADAVVVGLIKVATGDNTTFTFGTTGFADAGVTTTFYSAVAIPAGAI